MIRHQPYSEVAWHLVWKCSHTKSVRYHFRSPVRLHSLLVKIMKLLPSLLLSASFAVSAHASTVIADLGGNFRTQTQTLTQSVTLLSSPFTFAQFNPSLGTLTGISLSILESNDSGSFHVTATTNVRVKSPTDFITLTDNQGSGGGHTGSSTAFLTSPGTATGLGHPIIAGNSQTYTLTGKSLINSTPVTKDLSNFLAAYTGTGSVSFGANTTPRVSVTGGAGTQNLTSWGNTTQIALVYSYTIPEVSAVPEASSSLALLALGAGGLLTRRRKQCAA